RRQVQCRQQQRKQYPFCCVGSLQRSGRAVWLHHHRTEAAHSCCGWSDDPDQNVFFNTPWTREANSAQLNASATNLMRKIVYPLSCCTQLAEKSDRNLCVRARDGRLARKRGYIFAKVLCIIMTVPMVIEHFVAPSSPTASPDSSTASQKADSDAQQRRVRFADQKQPRDQRNRNP
uniref:G_PROTEIN_RECEP_F1_2 domain-containing protein n=1 Tax=Macrostomum lignano TaxID=282301 RepID=A0A1I8J6N7_9PLAT